MTPKSPEEELIRAGHAREVLESPIFLEACQRIEDALRDQRRAVPVRDTEMHTRLILTEQLWSHVRDYLDQAVQSGKLAEFTIKQRDNLQWNGLKRA
jgi:hypothetical protein